MKRGIAGNLSAMFVNSKLTIILVVASILLGLFAVIMLPREEEPQIKVPMIDIFVSMHGKNPLEVENTVTIPMEKLLWEIPDVEYIYSSSNENGSFIIVRYKVGTDLENALVRLNQKLQANFDKIPHGVSFPLVKPRSIDDVPILALTLHSSKEDFVSLRKLAKEIETSIKSIPEVSETTIIGGQRNSVKIVFDKDELSSRNLDAVSIVSLIQSNNFKTNLSREAFQNREGILEFGSYFNDTKEIENMLLGNVENKPIFLKDVAKIYEEAKKASDYVFNFNKSNGLENAVTISIAKRPNSNAIDVVNDVLKKVDFLKTTLIPQDVSITVSRDYGHTAAEKSNELLLHMFIAIFGVAMLILLFLGWRESLVVMLAIPSTLALTLCVFYFYGYTLNRITLFALIFSIGILVDDAIVVVENIARHIKLPSSKNKTFEDIAIEATDEVGNSTILATWAVIAAILPMAFVGGLMGPYMRPIPIGSTAAMIFSLLVAFTVTPWAFTKIMRRHFDSHKKDNQSTMHSDDEVPTDFFTKLYMSMMRPMLEHKFWRASFLFVVIILLFSSFALVPLGFVEVKMLPFDNKSEFQVIINAKEGTTLENTLSIAKEMANTLSKENEVENMQIYAGTASPYNFSGLVRHYFLRNQSNMADIQVNLVPKSKRSLQSHDIAKKARELLIPIAKKYNIDFTVAEVPPGPPVLQSLVAEIYGGTFKERLALAKKVENEMKSMNGVVDIYSFVESPKDKFRFLVDKEKSMSSGVDNMRISKTLSIASEGISVDKLHLPDEKEDVEIIFEFPDSHRSTPQSILNTKVLSNLENKLIPLSEIVNMTTEKTSPTLYRKNLKPVVYVTADVAGNIESPAYALLELNKKFSEYNMKNFGNESSHLKIYNLNLPFDDDLSIKWDGEWHITLEVFRDLGLAFAAVLVLIAVLMIAWFKSYKTPFVVMLAIPFSLVGILPAHWALGAFFTATSMIGFMAGAGIVVRNSIILVDFIELRLRHGHNLEDSVVEAGALRFRPMLLTALAVVVGASVILADPIFQGLAISLMFGEIASLLLSRMAVPILYFMFNNKAQ